MKLLVVEEDDLIATSVDFRLRKHGFEIQRVVGGELAIEAVKKAVPDIMVIASKLSDMNGSRNQNGLYGRNRSFRRNYEIYQIGL